MQREARLAAFFDVDNTLLNTKSMFSFQAFLLDTWLPSHGRPRESFAEFKVELEAIADVADRKALNRAFYASYAGLRETDVIEAAGACFEALARTRGDSLWIREAVELAQGLKAKGHLLVVVSGSTQVILQPVLDALGVDHCLATKLETIDGRYTGQLLGTQMIGEGKGESVRDFAALHGVDLAHSSACGDHISDISMLTIVGHPTVVSGDPALEAIAFERGWPIIKSQALDPDHAHAHV